MLTNARRKLLGIVVAILCVLFARPAAAQDVESWVVTIDASSTQPVGTGFVPSSADGSYIILAEGALRVYGNPGRYDDGWFGPAGVTRLERAGQPIADGMPYGALVGGFHTSVPAMQFHGRMGSTRLAPADVGNEFHVALNMSDADLTALEGQVTVTVIHVPDGSAEVSHVVLDRNGTFLAPTGFTAASGDKYIVLPYGATRVSFLDEPYTRSWWGPEGLLGFNRAGQPMPEGPYGGLYATYYGAPDGFYIGDGGCWDTQPADLGYDLKLYLNLSPADKDSLLGCGIVAHVIRVPASSAHVQPPSTPLGFSSSTTPNPATNGTTIRFSAASAGPATIDVFDARGARVRSWSQIAPAAGGQSAWWDGRDDSGRRVPAGTYFYRVRAGAETHRGRIAVID